MNIYSEENIVENISVGDKVTMSFIAKSVNTDVNGVNSMEASDIEIEDIKQSNSDSLNPLKRAMQRASLAHEPSRAPIPSPSA